MGTRKSRDVDSRFPWAGSTSAPTEGSRVVCRLWPAFPSKEARAPRQHSETQEAWGPPRPPVSQVRAQRPTQHPGGQLLQVTPAASPHSKWEAASVGSALCPAPRTSGWTSQRGAGHQACSERLAACHQLPGPCLPHNGSGDPGCPTSRFHRSGPAGGPAGRVLGSAQWRVQDRPLLGTRVQALSCYMFRAIWKM